MHRSALLQQLRAYEPDTTQEAVIRDEIISFVRANEHCFERSNPGGHLTGSAWIINSNRQRVLLVHHRKLGKWIQPGGHADGQTDLSQVAYREALEETGIKDLRLVAPDIFDLDIHPIPVRRDEPDHFHYDVRYLFIAGPEDGPIRNHESLAVRWIDLTAVHEYNSGSSLRRMIEKIHTRFPGS
ncbi:MAG: NUDIX hydrolase [Fidelibacterota bacterium]